MKNTTSLLSLFFLLFAFTTTTVAYIFDSDGDMLKNGGTYILSPANGGGGIVAAAIRHGETDECSLAVVQHEFYSGWPVTIEALVKLPFIPSSHQLRLSFAYIVPNICTNNSNWILKSSNDFEGNINEAVMIDNGNNPLSYLFYIKPYDFLKKQYKLVVCSNHDLCSNIGLKSDKNGYKRFVVTKGDPLVLQFDKVYKKGSFASQPLISMVV